MRSAVRWGVPYDALADLREQMRLNGNDYMPEKAGASEAAVQAAVRLEASLKGVLLWRNNVGPFFEPHEAPPVVSATACATDGQLFLWRYAPPHSAQFASGLDACATDGWEVISAGFVLRNSSASSSSELK